jgi:uncharacterized Zn finger protein
MSFYFWRPYVSAAERRKKAGKAVAKMKKAGKPTAPVVIEGRTIARSFWGKAWCDNLERYSDYANRLPRGRTYVRNGSVIDLQIARGEVTAAVMGSRLYTIRIGIVPVSPKRWSAICRDCSGSIDSLVELLQGKLAKGVMDRVCRQGDGLFPAPADIKLSCSCPDWADMCKHVAAVLYGVGSRLDERPELLFTLRCVDETELVAGADASLPGPKSGASKRKVLAGADLGSVFGLDMDGAVEPNGSAPKPRRTRYGLKGKERVAAKSSVRGSEAERGTRAKPDVAGRKTMTVRSSERGKTVPRKRSPVPAQRTPLRPTTGPI